ncbi:MarR family transcriptional regulator [Clostridium sp. HBUAS56010]|uniref:MarR family winged helix-turn-helix transcriptional regulator n=1 Tax=Clostridium sp. HBUAS56010 TaxID=2571127 RepID=UPI00163DCF21|nr:MarR family transcriptional regulator [Clostridium sp. HBUAS56010]
MNEIPNKKGQICKLNTCLFFSTAKLSRVFGRIAEEAFLKTGLSPSHAILLYLVNNKGSMKQKDLGEALHLTPSTITRLIEKLEHKHLIMKQQKGKQVSLTTTKEGLALQDQIVESWNQLNRTYESVLTEEETTQFIEISKKLLNHLENN